MSRRTILKALSLLLASGLFTYLLTQPDEVSLAQTGVFDRSQYANDRPVGDLQTPADELPATGEFNVMIELFDAPTSKVYAQALGNQSDRAANPQQRAAARGAARAQMVRIRGAQQRVLAHLGNFGQRAKVLYGVQTAYNGIAARIDAGILAQLRSHADVKAVHALPVHYIENSTSLPFIKAASAWAASNGNAGDGVRIAIIDTGTDYLHANFGGPGTAAAFAANNRAIIEPGTFPTAKVVGGMDFAGDAYTGANIPVPDPDPLDCNGHGSHVAGTATGLGVNADGTTYLGPYDASTVFSSFSIGPGVAPRAKLYSLKVFGCQGSTGLTTQAINWAVDPNGDGDPSDHVDVINMSLGSNFGTSNDASALASSNAALAGVIVVTSAGNAGDTHFITSSPGTSTRAISVANIVDFGLQLATLGVNSPPAIAGNKAALPAAFNPLFNTPTNITGSVKLGNDGSTAPFPGSPAGTIGTTTDACQPFAPGFFTGQIALVDRGGGCGFTFKVKNAQDAGATGVIVANNVAGANISMGGVDPTINVLSLSITQADGNAIKGQLGTGVNATLRFTHQGDLVSGSTSRGTRRDDLGVKPDISAPGTNITSTGFSTGNLSLTISGTSMASPHVAGTMALLRQLHPTWTVEELKALVMNTANHDLFTGVHGTGLKFGVPRIGAGRLDAADASNSEVVAFSDDDSGGVSVSFGAPEVVGTANLTKTVRVENKGPVDVSYNLSYVGLTDVPGVSYSFPDGPNITVPGGGSTTFRVELTANAAAMFHVRDLTMIEVQANNPRYWMSEESGYVTLTPDSGTALRLSLYAAPRPASNMATEHDYVLFTAPTGSTNVGLTGQDVFNVGAPPFNEISLVSAFELQENSPAVVPADSLASNADLKSVGVTSDFKATNSVVPNATKLFFGITTHGKWSTPSDVQFNIFIDRDRNGTDDFQIINTAFSDAQGNLFDVFVSARRTLSPFSGFVADSFLNNISPANIDSVPYNTNMMIIPVNASAIGLTTANAKFNYRIVTTSRGFGGIIDQTPTRTYDAANPGFDLTGGVQGLSVYLDLNGGSIPVNYNKANFLANGSLGLLLLHHHNTFGAHDQILSVQEPTATTVTVAASSGVYSDSTTLSATVSPATYLDQTISGNVQFSVDGNPVGAAVAVNSSGVASTSYVVNVPAGAHTITAAFTSTNTAFLNSSNTGTLTVSREDATVSASAANPFAVKVNAPGGTGGPITLCFELNEVSDGSPGDTTNITSVTVSVTPIGSGSAIPATAVLSGGGVGATRTACVTLNNVPVNVYDVSLTINGNFYQGTGHTVLTVFDPSLGFVTGGGSIIHNGYKATIGVSIKYLKSDKAQGSLLYIEHRPTGDVVLKSNAIGSMAIVANEAIPTGKATLNGVGNHSFIARIIDNGEPGSTDRFGLRVTNPAGAILIDLTFDPIQLSGGNFSVPKLTGN